ncbi:MAG: hypothetical protein LBN41_11725, partial [Enterobacteriaceae bacterium]|nr:hypothetical protein [Enterobacteriaceae bacterium]
MKTILKIIAAFFILIICFLSLYYFFAIRPDDDKCRALSTQSSKHNDFYVFVDKLAERRIDKSGKLWVVTWHNLTNMYDAIDTQIVADITHNSVKYLSDAIQVISSPEYDESQKVYTAMVMQKLP